MFHRAMPQTTSEQESVRDGYNQYEVMTNAGANTMANTTDRKQFRNRVESSAVERYAKSQDEIIISRNLANQNINSPVHVYQQNEFFNEKEVSPMNNPMNNQEQAKDNSIQNNDDKKPAMAPMNRDVNIPGSNFQRPNPAIPGRPAYPGNYAPAGMMNNPYNAQQKDTGRKLVIGQGITMSGEIESCEHLIVEGTIEATLKGASVLDVSQTGAFLGTVEIDEANIAGRFEGDITVRGRLTIEATGQVIGSITYKELSMEAGAVIDGSVSPIGSQNAARNKPSMQQKARKVSQNDGAELPFSDNKNEAA